MTAQETNLVNAFETTLDGAVASGDNSGISLADDPGVAAKVYLVFDPDNDSKREIVLWNSGAYGAMAVTRDVDAKHSPDPAHADGTKVRLAVVKQHIEDVHDRVDVIVNADGTAVNTSGIVKDQDDMSSNSATHLATQQSIKAYVDASGLSLIDEDDFSTDSATRPPSQQSVKSYIAAQGFADIGMIIALGG